MEEVVIDNLKAAVLKASLDDAVLSIPYARLARHYGFLVHPCRVRTPRHKGKVENGVRYVKRSFLAGREFVDIEDGNSRLLEWVMCEAGVREHGTTHEAPLSRFAAESTALLPLPAEPFELVRVAQAKVSSDMCVQIDGSYYQVPPRYKGMRLDAYVYERTVQIYDGVELVVTHERATRKGQRLTREEFYPPEKSAYVTRPRQRCLELASEVGPKCAELVDGMLSERPLDKLRSVHGVLRLGEKYGSARLEAACARALHYGDGSYVRVKKILEAGLDAQPLESASIQRPLPLYEYSRRSEEFFGELAREVGRC